MSFAGCMEDELLGPTIRGCRGDFDFTLKFEKIFLDLIPASIFLAASLPRAAHLLRKPIIVGGSLLRAAKLLTIGAYSILLLALLGLSVNTSARLRELFVSAAALNVSSGLVCLLLSYLEHQRSARPSMLLNSYLSLTILFDIAQVRTLWLASATDHELTITRASTAALAIKALITCLESQNKTRWLKLDVKQHSPEEMTGVYGLGAFFWLNSLFFTGYRKVLTMSDLYPLDSSMSAEALEARLSSTLQRPGYKGRKLGLGKALARTLTVDLLIPIGPRIAYSGFKFCQPFLISSVLSYLEQSAAARDRNMGYGLIGATVLIYFGTSFSSAFYWYYHERAMWKTRGALASAIYKKTLHAKVNVADDSASVTLMSTDVERIRQGMLNIHEFWANTVEVAVASFLLYRSLGMAFVAPIFIVGACVLAASSLATSTSSRQTNWMDKIQARVGMTASVIANMKNLKISGLALPIQSIVQDLRLEELAVGSRFRMVLCWSVVIAHVPAFIAPVATFAWTSETLTVTRMFTSYSYLTLLTVPLSSLFQCVPQVLAAIACLGRIQSFLEDDSRQDFRSHARAGHVPSEKPSTTDSSSNDGGQPPAGEPGAGPAAISISGGEFGWSKHATSLRNIDLAIRAGKLTMVVGPIASGKSTLCKALLGETPAFDGCIVLSSRLRRIGYCDQTPFLSNSTIKSNIIGFSAFDSVRYNEVIEATMLRPDFLTLPQGDDTKIGSNGISLSGGQKQRVSMARALYLNTDLLIFDDVLSGLDADTEDQVFRHVFGARGLIKRRGATAVLCTHAVAKLPSADHIIAIGPDGKIEEQGTFGELMARQRYISSLGVEASMHRAEPGPDAVSSSAIRSEVQDRSRVHGSSVQNPQEMPLTGTGNFLEEEQDERVSARANGDRTVYMHYYKSIGFWPVFSFLAAALLYGFFDNWQTIWLNFWSTGVAAQEAAPREERSHHGNAFYLGLFALFQAAALSALFVNVWVTVKWLINISGASLHKAALHTLINAPLRFFTTTDTGVVTNLFSQDMTLIDGELPISLINVAVDASATIGMAAVIATSSPYLAISYPFLIAVIWLLQKFYLMTSRQLRLLDLEAKSPLYTHFLDTAKGIATFRAFGWEPQSLERNNRLLDDSQRPAYLLSMIQRWLSFVLDCVVAVLAITVVTMATQVSSGTGFTGASLVTLMNFGANLTFVIRMYTQLETSLGAINRLKTFSETVKPETSTADDVVPDALWPSRGEIRIDGVSASYFDVQQTSSTEKSGVDVEWRARNLALQDLNISIPSGEKVAICGRSGSGKSSTLLLLLRLLEPTLETADNVSIDNLPLSRIDRQTLRQRLISVPQEAVFLPSGSSFRANLDPLGVSSDLECRSVLQTVGLWEPLVSKRGGLAAGMGADMSQGQKQLFSLARAILRRRVRSREVGTGLDRGILLLDEVSSSVDVDTDRAMQAIIKTEFEGYTIVMVSHRLQMVMDFDRVIVMDKGSVVEMGAPRTLVDMEGSRFRELYLLSNAPKEGR